MQGKGENMRNRVIDIVCILLILILGYLSIYFYYGSKGLERDLNNWGQNNNLNLERDFQIYAAIQEKDMSKMKEDLELNLMFHLTAIEKYGIQNSLDIVRIERVCKKYLKINTSFKRDYENKYPSAIMELEKICK